MRASTRRPRVRFGKPPRRTVAATTPTLDLTATASRPRADSAVASAAANGIPAPQHRPRNLPPVRQRTPDQGSKDRREGRLAGSRLLHRVLHLVADTVPDPVPEDRTHGHALLFLRLRVAGLTGGAADETTWRQTVFCQDCGAANPDAAKFCVKCGKQIAGLTTAPPPPTPDLPPPETRGQSGGNLKAGCGFLLLIGAVVLLLEDIGAGGIGWFWRIVMVVMIIAAARIFYSRR